MVFLAHCISRMENGKNFSAKCIMNEFRMTRKELIDCISELHDIVNPIVIKKIFKGKKP